MSSEEKSGYYSVSGSISQMTSEKRLGQHYIKVEGTMGNQKAITIRNKDDLAEVTANIELKTLLWDQYEAIKKEGENRGYKFVEVADS